MWGGGCSDNSMLRSSQKCDISIVRTVDYKTDCKLRPIIAHSCHVTVAGCDPPSWSVAVEYDFMSSVVTKPNFDINYLMSKVSNHLFDNTSGSISRYITPLCTRRS